MAFRIPWVGARGIRKPPMGAAIRHDRDLERSSFGKTRRVEPVKGLSLKSMMTGMLKG